MLTNVKASEAISLLAAINPSSQAAGTANSGWVDASNFHRILGLIKIGALGASATVDAKFQQATDSSGTNAKDIANKAITQVTSTNNQQEMIDVRPGELDVANGFRYVQLSITVGTAATLTDGAVFGVFPRDTLVASNNASLKQVVG